jgi:pseudaminic acid cytidylyltransferase
MSAVAIIPARGGSQRIPRKNIRPFCGQPIIAYSIQAALQSQLFDQVIVSTDDKEIAEVARSYGAQVPFLRPKTLADNYTGTAAVMANAVNFLAEKSTLPDYSCCIYATAPLLQMEYLQKGWQELSSRTDKSFSFSVTSYTSPIQRAFTLTDDGLRMFYPEYYMTRSQDLLPAFHDAGQFYWGKSHAWLNEEVMYSPLSIPIQLPRQLVQDIDTLEDWQHAELLYQILQKTRMS